jgi:cob(I)alamin adenosyltransferase
MSKFFTRSGDDGNTGLLGQGRYPKNHPRLEALGTLDETSAALGLARALSRVPESAALLVEVQRDLYTLMTEVAASPENSGRFPTLGQPRLDWLETQTEALSERVPVPREFILPGESPAGAAFSLARTIARRAERRVVELFERKELTNPLLLQYLNRLSSLCFALELVENQQAGQAPRLAKDPDR